MVTFYKALAMFFNSAFIIILTSIRYKDFVIALEVGK